MLVGDGSDAVAVCRVKDMERDVGVEAGVPSCLVGWELAARSYRHQTVESRERFATLW